MGQKVRGKVAGEFCVTPLDNIKSRIPVKGGGEILAPVLRFRRIPLSLEFVESQQAAPASSLTVKTCLHCSSVTLGLTVGSPASVIP